MLLLLLVVLVVVVVVDVVSISIFYTYFQVSLDKCLIVHSHILPPMKASVFREKGLYLILLRCFFHFYFLINFHLPIYVQ